MGFESERSRWLNGHRGQVVQFIEAEGRYEVSFGPEKMVLLKAENLKKIEPPPKDAASETKTPPAAAIEKAKPASLASLLGMGRVDAKPAEPKAPAWESVWQRSGATAPTATLTDEQQEVFLTLQKNEETRQQQEQELRRRVVAELAEAGVTDEAMIQQVYEEQLEKRKLDELMRPQDLHTRRDRSRSSSSSSRSRSRSRSRSQSKSRDDR